MASDIVYDRIGSIAATTKKSAGAQHVVWPRWFRYGAMKEAFPVWHEAAMRFDSTMAGRETAKRDIGSLKDANEVGARV